MYLSRYLRSITIRYKLGKSRDSMSKTLPANVRFLVIPDEQTSNYNNQMMYRKLWSLGDAGITVMLNIKRDGEDMDVSVKSDSRYNLMSKRSNH